MVKTSTRIKQNASSFCEQTTVHGFAYVVDSSNHFVIKIGWFVLVTVFMILACHLIKSSFDDWQDNPTVTTIDSAAFPIENIPFPSVTVCHADPGIR